MIDTKCMLEPPAEQAAASFLGGVGRTEVDDDDNPHEDSM